MLRKWEVYENLKCYEIRIVYGNRKNTRLPTLQIFRFAWFVFVFMNVFRKQFRFVQFVRFVRLSEFSVCPIFRFPKERQEATSSCRISDTSIDSSSDTAHTFLRWSKTGWTSSPPRSSRHFMGACQQPSIQTRKCHSAQSEIRFQKMTRLHEAYGQGGPLLLRPVNFERLAAAAGLGGLLAAERRNGA